MKSSFTILTVVLAVSMAMAQGNATPNQAGSQSGQTQGQTGATNPSPGAAQTPATGGNRILQAKSQDELKAYQDASAKTDAAQMAAAADAFAAKYPNSEMKGTLYARSMSLYGQANNSEKVIEEGRKSIAADPTNPVPLVQVASVLAETTRDTDLDREQRLNESAKDAQAAIDNINTGLIIPPNAPPERVAGAKASILTMAYDTLGVVNLSKKDYAAAEQSLLKAADISKANPDAVVYLRLSVAQDNLKKYPQALESATKAVQLAPPGSTAQNLAKQQQGRVQKLMDAGSGSSTAAPPAVAPAPAKPATPPANTTPPTNPH
jgi:tetratricopeptide (TPR) repeat protein